MHFRHDQVASAQSVTVRCRFFARYAEILGMSEATLELPRSTTVAEAVAFIRERLPGGNLLPPRPLVAINAVHALAGEELHEGDELALLPPVAGGAPVSRLTRGRIDVAEILGAMSDPGLGGTVVFLGSVRQGGADGPVTAIEYSAHEEMAAAELERIIGEARGRWTACRVEVQHRLGLIPAGEASIAVVVASPHRAESFEACRFAIEEIKKRLPIWKKEIFQDGSAEWRGNDGSRGPAAAV